MTIQRSVLILLCLCCIASCSDDNLTDEGANNNSNNTNTDYTNEVTATINGVAWSAATIHATRNEAGGIVPVTLSGFGLKDSRITFGISFASVKAHTIDNQAVQAEFAYEGKSYDEEESGTITITDLTSKGMRGSFSINAETTDGESGTAIGNFDVEFN